MPLRVLVGDDERHIVRLAEFNLQRCGYEVLTATDADAVIRLAQTERPDLIVIDAGWAEVADTLRQDPVTQDIRLILLDGGMRMDPGRWSI